MSISPSAAPDDDVVVFGGGGGWGDGGVRVRRVGEPIEWEPSVLSGVIRVRGVRARTAIGRVRATGGAAVEWPGGTALSMTLGHVTASGVQNLTDEELLAVLVAVV